MPESMESFNDSDSRLKSLSIAWERDVGLQPEIVQSENEALQDLSNFTQLNGSELGPDEV